ncbi:class I SAM-dependent methyltransferase [Streptomyces sp. NBC_01803]|uniref:class I SAM-dependent methyltransferase n=1 Tax=Streptomyces sp. NBC_01803 TaxID=2975946 RepID=UPI002DD7C91E|nr:class I SAM-dependent methyltransferase [Streptomyces sp. NBC_01803]WSA42871.1 class I SAM-dependent methyltransferase [Streptomyces sp. NBC_01803]
MAAARSGAPTITDLFDEIAELYEEFSGTLDSAENPLSEWMAAHLPKGRRALDIGCGAGRYTVMLAALYDEVVGADAAPAMIDIARRDRSRSNVDYQVRDAFDLTPAKDGLFDVVFGFSSVFLMGEPRVILPHLAALVAPGGAFVVFEPERPADYGQENWRINFAFTVARTAYEVTGRLESSINVLRLFSHRNWTEISERTAPMNGREFRREYTAALPGSTFMEHVFPGLLTAYWQRPAR